MNAFFVMFLSLPSDIEFIQDEIAKERVSGALRCIEILIAAGIYGEPSFPSSKIL
jgi:hypothetical protein